jgi:glycosyltransferase involved in cell wall biosynthesis
MGVHGRDDVRAGFSWDVIVGRLAEVYERVRRR